MILARCPACATTFRVRPEQLRARQGRVRCGQCQHAFNALETLVDEGLVDDTAGAHAPVEPAPIGLASIEPAPAEPASSEPPAAEAPTPVFVLEEKTTLEPFPPIEPSPDEPADEPQPLPKTPEAPEPFEAVESFEAPAFLLDDLDSPDQPAEPAFEAPPPADAIPSDDARLEPHGEIEAPAEWPAVEPESESPAPVFDLPDTAAESPAWAPFDDEPPLIAPAEPAPLANQPADTGAHSAEPEPAPAFAAPSDWPDPSELDLKAEPLDFDSLLHRKDAGEAAALAGAPVEPPPAPMASFAARPGTDERADTPPAPDGDEDDETESEPETEEKPSGLLRQAAWAAGATLLALLLLAQGMLVFRNQIVQSSPHMRPLMESLCAGIGCDLPLPREAALISIENSDIQPDAGREAFFTLHVTLRNRAEFAQAHPHLEVTLTDARDKALVRRVLEPAQWLPADAPKDAFPAHREIAAKVAFEAPLVAAAGYRVWVFYP